MKREKITIVPMGGTYKVNYVLDIDDVIDAKVYDMSRSGMYPQMIPCDMQENGGARVFEYMIQDMKPLSELLKSTVGKREMLTILYNVLEGLESFGKGMVSLSYVSKDIQHIFVSPDTCDIRFVVAPVSKEHTDMNEVRKLIKNIIIDATYSEGDRDNYVARLINFVNVAGTFSSSDMKEHVKQLLMEMGVDVSAMGRPQMPEDNSVAGGNSHILRSEAPSPKVSRLGVMRNNARMNGGMPPMGPNGMQPMNGGMPPMGPNGMQPMNGGMPPMGPNGMPPMGNPFGEASAAPMNENPFGEAPVAPMNDNPFGGAPMPPMNENPFGGAPMPPMGNPFGEAPAAPMNEGPFSEVPPVEPENNEPAEDIQEQPAMNGNPFGGAPMPPMGNPFGEAPAAPMNENPFGGAPMSPMGNPFGEAPAAPMNESPFSEVPPVEPENNEPAEDIQKQPAMNSNPFGGAPMPPVNDNPFGGAPVPPMGNPFGEAPAAPMNDNPFGGAPMPPMGNPFGEAPAAPMNDNPFGGAPAAPMNEGPFSEVPPVEPENNEPAEDIQEQPPMNDNPFGGTPVPPMNDNPFSEAPVPPMNDNPFGGAPAAPMNDNPFGGAPMPPISEGPVPYFIRMRTGERIDIDKAEFKIGRKSSDVDYAVTGNTDISRVHCLIVKDRGVCFISDNNSTNGTFINGQRLNEGEKKFLTNDAVVILGNEEFVYHIR